MSFLLSSIEYLINPNDSHTIEGIDFVSEPLNIELPPTSDEVLSALYQLSPPERLNAMRPESSPQCARIQIINDAISEQDSNKQLDLSLQTNNPNIVVDRSKSSATISIQDDDCEWNWLYL